MFGLAQLRVFLNDTIKEHLKSKKDKFYEQTKKIEEIVKDLDIDDIITGGCTVEEVSQVKAISISTFQDAGLQLHNWNSDRIRLEDTLAASQVEGSNHTCNTTTRTIFRQIKNT